MKKEMTDKMELNEAAFFELWEYYTRIGLYGFNAMVCIDF